ncbi:hypothetical protein GCM10007938_35220 [Vibrio zhanjiangensis]|uniref:DUF1311 domain-containing protein n=1 Tax=Vibrio zhanjiangensis TaxID=1046128 RepID=A0ABQ6F3A9_9VIBR|nr:hypothetical protein [Vibrio zhanjiangensis]GLT19739.1 hypothetical protein GCM10007938_35220 [Vibrio zhanjiangensis]
MKGKSYFEVAKLIMVLWLYCVSFQLNAMSEASANWLFEKQKQCDIKIDSLKKDIQSHADNLSKGNYNEAVVSDLLSVTYKYVQEKCRFDNFEILGTETETLNMCDCLIDEYSKFSEYLVEKINLP